MGSEMCIRDRHRVVEVAAADLLLDGDGEPLLGGDGGLFGVVGHCLLYTSDAADERSSVDLGGRRIIKKKKKDKRQCRPDDH